MTITNAAVINCSTPPNHVVAHNKKRQTTFYELPYGFWENEKKANMTLGKEILLNNNMDFPLDFPKNRPVALACEGYGPLICKVIGIDELRQRIKLEFFLTERKLKAWLDCNSVVQAFEIDYHTKPQLQ